MPELLQDKLTVYIDALKTETLDQFMGMSREELIDHFTEKNCTINAARTEMSASDEHRATGHRWQFQFDRNGNVNDVTSGATPIYP